MAQRRMFSIRVISSARFLKMPLSSQALYFQLGMHADDDGVVEAFTVMRQVGALEDDLNILIGKGFVIVLNDDLVSYITDWNESNYIRADRKINSIYQPLLLKILPDVQIMPAKPRADTGKTTGKSMDNNWTPNGLPMDGLGKVKVKSVKGKLGEKKNSASNGTASKPSTSKPAPKKHKYGQYENVLLTDEQLTTLKKEVPKDWAKWIDALSNYIQSSGKEYNDHLATIRSWVKREYDKTHPQPKTRTDWFGEGDEHETTDKNLPW